MAIRSNLANGKNLLPTLGMIGCGNIGGRQVVNFLNQGYPVYVYDIDPDRMVELATQGAQITESCAELATYAEVIFTALPTPVEVITAVLEGEQNLSQGLRPGQIYIDISTNSPATIRRLDQVMQELGVEMLDAPFNDCPAGARSQKGMGLAILASGPQPTFQRVQTLLQLMADHVLYCGEIGRGTQCKLIHNAVNAVAVQAVSEGITLALAQGITLPIIWDALRLGSFGQNPGDIHGLPHYWFSRRFDDPDQRPAFIVKLLYKDLRLALDMALQSNVPVPQISLTIKDYEEAERQGWSYRAATKVRCLQEARAGVVAETQLPLISSVTQPTSISVSTPMGSSPFHQRKVSISVLLIWVIVSNLVQFGSHWLF